MKTIRLIACGIVATGFIAAGSAWGQSCGSFPANNQELCGQAGGQFSQPDGPSGINHCDVMSGEQLVRERVAPGCNEPSYNAGFQAEYSVFTLTRYSRAGSNCSTSTVSDSELVACYNSQGNQTDLDPCTCPTDDRDD